MKTLPSAAAATTGKGEQRLTPAHSTSKAQLLAMLAGGGLDDVKHQGDLPALQRLLSVLETPPATYAIVTP